MSRTVHYKGVMKKAERLEGESLEEQCKRLIGDVELPAYCEDYEEFLNDTFYQEMSIQNGTVYLIEKEEINQDDDILQASLNDNGDIEFEIRYYTGGSSFDEALQDAIHTIKN